MDAQTIFDLYNKINSLERKIIILQSQLEENKKQCIERIPESQKIPDSNLFSNNLITRSFTVYGHLLLASLIIGLISFDSATLFL